MTLEILKKYKIKAKKALGQNFLVNEKIVEKIANCINVVGQNIVEVGPGYGALTEKLINKKPLSLNLVELDKDMIEVLESRKLEGDFDLEGIDFNINNIDILNYQPQPILTKEGSYNYSVIANIPYYITSPILRHFLYDVENKPEAMVILMQEEVGDKILGKGKNKSSVLSLFIDKKSRVTKIIDVSKIDFVPAPKIDSVVLLFEYEDKYPELDDSEFFRIIKIGFAAARKKLIRNFTNAGYEKENISSIFKDLDIDENTRGEDLGIDIWVELIKKLLLI